MTQPDLFNPLSLDEGKFRHDRDLFSEPLWALRNGQTEPIVRKDPTIGRTITLTGADYGIASVKDQGPLIYAQSLMHKQMQAGIEPTPEIHYHIYDYLRSTGSKYFSKSVYEQHLQGLRRLTHTGVRINYERETSGGLIAVEGGTSFLSSYAMETTTIASGKRVNAGVRLTLSPWTFASFKNQAGVMPIPPAWFLINGNIERRLMSIIYRHAGGKSNTWFITVSNLQTKVGSDAEPRRFLFELRKIVAKDDMPDFHLSLEDRRPDEVFGRTTPSPLEGKGNDRYLVARRRGTLGQSFIPRA